MCPAGEGAGSKAAINGRFAKALGTHGARERGALSVSPRLPDATVGEDDRAIFCLWRTLLCRIYAAGTLSCWGSAGGRGRGGDKAACAPARTPALRHPPAVQRWRLAGNDSICELCAKESSVASIIANYLGP